MTRRAIGSYALDATDDQKITALRQALETVVFELVGLGVDASDIENDFWAVLEEAAEEENA